jgi:hypothetical protein
MYVSASEAILSWTASLNAVTPAPHTHRLTSLRPRRRSAQQKKREKECGWRHTVGYSKKKRKKRKKDRDVQECSWYLLQSVQVQVWVSACYHSDWWVVSRLLQAKERKRCPDAGSPPSPRQG